MKAKKPEIKNGFIYHDEACLAVPIRYTVEVVGKNTYYFEIEEEKHGDKIRVKKKQIMSAPFDTEEDALRAYAKQLDEEIFKISHQLGACQKERKRIIKLIGKCA